MPDLENVDQSDSDPEYQAAAHILYEGETGEDRLATVQRVIEECLIDSKIQPPRSHQIGDVLGICAHAVLELSPLYPGDELVPFGDERRVRKRFKLMRVSDHDYTVEDAYFNEFTILPVSLLKTPSFEPAAWYAQRRAEFFKMKNWVTRPLHRMLEHLYDRRARYRSINSMGCGAVQVPADGFNGITRTASMPRVPDKKVAKPLVVVVLVNNHPVRALVDSGSLGDLISTTIADQLALRRQELDKPITLQLAVQGSRSKINHTVSVDFGYQDIKCPRTFYVANLSGYDMILGTSWLFQHKVTIGLNPARVCIGSADCLPLQGIATARIYAHGVKVDGNAVNAARDELIEYAKPICKKVSETALPPLRAINHKIPLIDEKKILPWRPSRCPEALRPQWDEKRRDYLKT
ncbi:hypothetical protein B0H10DRAFT_1839920, partial [Mycena sp. CBHHK59/15]